MAEELTGENPPSSDSLAGHTSAKDGHRITLAHIKRDSNGILEHSLVEHLRAVAKLGYRNAAPFGAERWAYLAGLWHDLGKYRAGFQKYIRAVNDVDAHIEGKVGGRDKTHSAAGALWAKRFFAERGNTSGQIIARILSYVIAGHHAGLDNWHGGLKERLALDDTSREFEEALTAGPPDEILHPGIPLPELSHVPVDTRTGIPGSFALWVRMLFSALVDADFLDTEAFMDESKALNRQGHSALQALSHTFDRHMQRKLEEIGASNDRYSPINRLRADVLRQCRDKAALAPGVFTLTVPTGGGKTLSSMAFALRHAIHHGKRRIVYAIPYTSIIEQTADIFREIFGDDNVVEHHSNVESDPAQETHRSRLACENWDAPLIVTTNVQLFESLFARRTSRCRKLHNLVGSVIVLDEAQLLPVDFLQPVLDALRLLVRDYGVTLVLCTATQPALTRRDSFDPSKNLRGFDPSEVTEIVDDVYSLYRALRRVRVHRPLSLDVKREWQDIAGDILKHESVLAIVNRRADARKLHELLNLKKSDELFHLSALMCAQHRSDTISRIRQALADRRRALECGVTARSVRVVSTQLIEAGVDIDFPVVFRALAGLDSVAQAAGRCNREGKLAEPGHVYVFVPLSQPPPGLLRQAATECKVIWSQLKPEDDGIDVSLYANYFRRLYSRDLDIKAICAALRVGKDGDVRFRDAAEDFRLIDDKEAATVLVRYRSPRLNEDINSLIGLLERDGPQRWLMRKLQRYGVSIYRHDLARLLAQGDVRCADNCPDLYMQTSDLLYDVVCGLNVDGAPGDPAQLVV